MSKEVKKLVDQAKRAFADKQLDLAEKICQVCYFKLHQYIFSRLKFISHSHLIGNSEY